MITALILFAVATAEVKGFALMLLIGTVVSLITAVAATRAMLGLLAGFKLVRQPEVHGRGRPAGLQFLQIDFMRRRNTWFAISGVVLLIGLVSLGVRGLNLGIDFKGGVQITFTTQSPTSLSTCAPRRRRSASSDAVVQGRGKSTNGGESYKSFQIRLKKLNSRPSRTSSRTCLTTQGARAEARHQERLVELRPPDRATSAIFAIIVSLLMITLYITHPVPRHRVRRCR